MEAIHAEVRGLVQGVGFRYATRRVATHLGLAGWVRNLPGGAVEVWAQGPSEAIARFRTFLETGPRGAAVVTVVVEPVEPDADLAAFEVRF